jgi:DNA replication and repair protein RecF
MVDLTFDGRPVVLFGENGAGKTNLLEAISMLSPGRGLRRAKTANLSYRGPGEDIPSTSWAIAARLEIEGEPVKIGTGQIPDAPSRRQVRINENNASGTDLARLLTLNWLTPTQDRLFAGPESDRRKFFDRLCLVYFPDHGRTSIAYEKSRAERNRLLGDGIDDDYWFDALETDMAERGAHIAKARFETLLNLRQEIDERPDSVFPKAVVALNGEAEALFEAGADEADVSEFIKDTLQKDRGIDRRAGRTLRGIHKTELIVTHAAKNMPAADCSTGEQKALLIGLILAHANSQKKHDPNQRAPILLLDEVAAHLDEQRRAALIEELLELETQVFLTGTDIELFSAFEGRAQVFEVKDGNLNPQ